MPQTCAERCANFEERRDKALELFAVKGFGQVSMRELASHLGLTAGSLYHHFPSKQHLLFDLIEELFEELLATLQPPRRSRGSSEDWLTSVIDAHWQLHRERPLQFRLAERDLCCLTDEQQARIKHLRDDYECQLLRLIAPTAALSKAARQAAGHAIATLLNSLPGWLQSSELPEAQRLTLMQNLLLGAIERTLHDSAQVCAA